VAGQPLPTPFEPEKLLVRGVNWLGDAIMTMPAIQRLRERFPRAQVTLLTNEKLADLWQQHSGIDRILTFGNADTPWSIAQRLRNNAFEAALVLPNSPRSALEVWLARIPRRIGYAGKWRSWLLTRPLEHPPGCVRLRRRGIREIKRLIQAGIPPTAATQFAPRLHQTHDYLELAAALGADPAPTAPKLELNADEAASVAAFLSRIHHGQTIATGARDNTVWLGMNPSTAYGPAKRWPSERFAEVAGVICHRVPNSIWLVFGADTDRQICEEAIGRGRGRMINMAGQTSLRQLMGLLKNCKTLLTNDSGPMHLAAALGVPVVAPFGSTSPELTGPGQPGDPRHHLLQTPAACAPCFRRTCPIDFRCMTGITVDQVLAAVLATIKMGSQ
jgi:heptosyltransferase-2